MIQNFRLDTARSSKFEIAGGNWQAPAGPAIKKDLVFFDGDGVLLTNFDAGFATETFLFVHRDGLAILKFVHFNGANIHTLATTDAFVVVDGNRITHDQPPKFFLIPAYAG
jgi:hypothetical protein